MSERTDQKQKTFKRPQVKTAVKEEDIEKKQQEEKDKIELQIAMSKLLSIAESYKKLGRSSQDLFESLDVDLDKRLTSIEFGGLVKRFGAQLDQYQEMLVFQHLDTDKDRQVSTSEFFQKIKFDADSINLNTANFTNYFQMMVRPEVREREFKRKDQRRQTMKDTYKRLGTSEEEIQKKFDEFLAKVELDESDYFNGCPTILNDPVKALKVCSLKVLETKKKPLGDWFYDDPHFGPTLKDPQGYSSICFEEAPFPGAPHPDDINWLRTSEICAGSNPEFVVGGLNSNDVIQGASLGDCWLIGALTVLAGREKYITGYFQPDEKNLEDVSDAEAQGMMMGLYPPIFHHYRRYGMYVIRFFKNFAWRYVIIDDKLPCFRTPDAVELIFASCPNSNEFWVPLIEKAFAKLHKNYQALISGNLSDALVDFTGLVSEKLVILDAAGRFNTTYFKNKEAVWDKLYRMNRQEALMGCSIIGGKTESEVFVDGVATGLMTGHAYGILDVLEITDVKGRPQRLIKLKNPWGFKVPKEWSGRWSDDSEEMVNNWRVINEYLTSSKRKQSELFNEATKRDGAFYMSFDDFQRIFCKLAICIKFPVEFQGIRFDSEWKGPTAGGTPYRNHPDQIKLWQGNTQFYFAPRHKTNLFISLGELDGRLRCSPENPYPYSSVNYMSLVMVFKTEKDKPVEYDAKKIFALSPMRQDRDISLEVQLEPGQYVIVPSTRDPGQEGKFYLSLYHDCAKEFLTAYNMSTKEEPYVIPEEEDVQMQVDPVLKQFLKFKASEVIFE